MNVFVNMTRVVFECKKVDTYFGEAMAENHTYSKMHLYNNDIPLLVIFLSFFAPIGTKELLEQRTKRHRILALVILSKTG